jgi:hypothetical protein
MDYHCFNSGRKPCKSHLALSTVTVYGSRAGMCCISFASSGSYQQWTIILIPNCKLIAYWHTIHIRKRDSNTDISYGVRNAPLTVGSGGVLFNAPWDGLRFHYCCMPEYERLTVLVSILWVYFTLFLCLVIYFFYCFCATYGCITLL